MAKNAPSNVGDLGICGSIKTVLQADILIGGNSGPFEKQPNKSNTGRGQVQPEYHHNWDRTEPYARLSMIEDMNFFGEEAVRNPIGTISETAITQTLTQ